jgi:hypothetical protein
MEGQVQEEARPSHSRAKLLERQEIGVLPDENGRGRRDRNGCARRRQSATQFPASASRRCRPRTTIWLGHPACCALSATMRARGQLLNAYAAAHSEFTDPKGPLLVCDFTLSHLVSISVDLPKIAPGISGAAPRVTGLFNPAFAGGPADSCLPYPAGISRQGLA